MKEELVGVLGVQFMNKEERYLGTSLFATSRPTANYKYLIEKTHGKLKGWKAIISRK